MTAAPADCPARSAPRRTDPARPMPGPATPSERIAPSHEHGRGAPATERFARDMRGTARTTSSSVEASSDAPRGRSMTDTARKLAQKRAARAGGDRGRSADRRAVARLFGCRSERACGGVGTRRHGRTSAGARSVPAPGCRRGAASCGGLAAGREARPVGGDARSVLRPSGPGHGADRARRDRDPLDPRRSSARSRSRDARRPIRGGGSDRSRDGARARGAAPRRRLRRAPRRVDRGRPAWPTGSSCHPIRYARRTPPGAGASTSACGPRREGGRTAPSGRWARPIPPARAPACGKSGQGDRGGPPTARSPPASRPAAAPHGRPRDRAPRLRARRRNRARAPAAVEAGDASAAKAMRGPP